MHLEDVMAILEKVKGLVRRKPKQMDLEEYIAKMKAKGYDRDGNVVLSPIPIAPPIGYKKSPSMVEIVRDMVRSERLRQELADSGAETFEESEDFDIPDEEHLHSPYENDFDPPVEELLKAGREVLAERERAAQVEKAKKDVTKAAGKVGGAGGTPPAEDDSE